MLKKQKNCNKILCGFNNDGKCKIKDCPDKPKQKKSFYVLMRRSSIDESSDATGGLSEIAGTDGRKQNVSTSKVTKVALPNPSQVPQKEQGIWTAKDIAIRDFNSFGNKDKFENTKFIELSKHELEMQKLHNGLENIRILSERNLNQELEKLQRFETERVVKLKQQYNAEIKEIFKTIESKSFESFNFKTDKVYLEIDKKDFEKIKSKYEGG